MKTNSGVLFKKMLAVMTVAAITAAVGLLGLLPALADEHNATRSFDPATVAPGGVVEVTITLADVGSIRAVTETLPIGFTYLSSSLDDVEVEDLGNRMFKFFPVEANSWTYTVTASSTEGSYTFSGLLVMSSDRADDVDVGGPSIVTVRSPDEATPTPAAVSGVTVMADPDDPGAAAEYTITFVTGAVLEADTAHIILNIDSSVGVPTSLSPNAVRIRADDITTSGVAEQNRPLDLAPVYRVIPGTDGRKEYKIRIPNMDGVPENAKASISEGAMVTLTLLSNSGFTNPTEANVVVFEDDKVTRKSGGDDFKVSTSKQTEGVSAYISTPLVLFSDDKADNRNKPLTITGKGFKNGTTAIVYLEEMVNGEPKETDLVSILVGSNDTFEATFNVTVPPFKAGKGNMIKAKDGETPPNRTETAVAFEVEGLMTASPKTAAIGDKIQISLIDWPDYTTDNPPSEATVKIAGIEQKVIGSVTVANGKATFQIEIGNDVPSGTEELQVDAAGESDSTNVVISGADLTVTPSTVVPNQNVTVVGQGFGDRAKINTNDDDGKKSNVEFGGDPAYLGVDSDNFNHGEGITTDSGGNWNASIVIPITGASTTEGTHTLDVKDSSGRSGSAEVVIAERKVTLDPPTARPGVMVQLTGSGFPASNRRSEQTAPPVSIEYGDDLVSTVNPDSSGNIATSFRIPFDASIPSSNTVTVKFTYTQNNANFDVIEHYTHEVPGATISLSASEGKPGDTITVTGEGFAQHASVSSMSIGTIDILPSPKPSTSRGGTFTTSVLIPGIDLGTHSIEVEISDTVASAVFRVVEETTMMPGVMMAEAAAPDVAFAAVIAEDNLIAVYHFDPSTQNEAPNYGYTIYDARPLFMSGNNLDSIEPGQFYTVEVSENQMGVTLGSQTVDLYAAFTPIRW